MNRDDIIRMAREAMGHTSIEPNDKVTFYVSYNNGIDADGFCDSVETFIEHFANLVAAAERERIIAANAPEIEKVNVYIKALEDAVAAEREACALVCDKLGDEYADANAADCAFAIRERGAP